MSEYSPPKTTVLSVPATVARPGAIRAAGLWAGPWSVQASSPRSYMWVASEKPPKSIILSSPYLVASAVK